MTDNTLINNYLEKYWLMLAYKNDIGFIEISQNNFTIIL